MTSYKLVYFDLKGRAEVIRLLFALSEENYEDIRISFEEWPNLKPTLPFLQAPILEIKNQTGENEIIAQSSSILRYLAYKFELAGRTENERAKTDMIYEQVNDMFQNLIFIYKIRNEQVKQIDLENALKNTIPRNLKLIQNILEKNPSGFLVGDSATYADIFLMNFYEWLRDEKNNILANLPFLKQHDEKIRSIPQISRHLNKHLNSKLSRLF